jgi:SNF2 family DNA or RNA helicase
MAAELINADKDQWIVWCGLNPEADIMAELIPGAVNVYGSMSTEAKTESIEAFQEGKTRVLVTKLKIAGLGLNLQAAHKMCFVGMNDSMEMYYQGVRRSLRYGQDNPVDVHIVLARCEEPILRNVQTKEREANYMMQELIAHSQEYQKAELKQEEWRKLEIVSWGFC